MILRKIRQLFGTPERPSRVEVLPDHVWMSGDAKCDGIRRSLTDLEADGVAAIALVAHFPDVLEPLTEIEEGYRGSIPTKAVLARQLSSEHAASLPVDSSAVAAFLVAERHPLRSRDEELMRFASALPCRSRFVYHVSFDDPLLRFLGADSFRAMLDKAGAGQDQPITHKFLTRSIERAQKKLETRARGEQEAESAAEWFERYT